MQTVFVIINFLVVIALIGVVLIQSSEGGGFGGGDLSFMRTRGSKNALTRLTAIIAACFFALSIGLVVIGNISHSDSDILNRIPVDLKKDSSNTEASEGILPSHDESQPSILEQLGGDSNAPQGRDETVSPALENPIPSPLKDPMSEKNVD